MNRTLGGDEVNLSVTAQARIIGHKAIKEKRSVVRLIIQIRRKNELKNIEGFKIQYKCFFSLLIPHQSIYILHFCI
jgi:hypothetical protein